jgi:hypothetical protein
MPDGWEVAYGLDPRVNDAQGDPDQDGLSNLQEYVAGTDPRTFTDTEIPPDVEFPEGAVPADMEGQSSQPTQTTSSESGGGGGGGGCFIKTLEDSFRW